MDMCAEAADQVFVCGGHQLLRPMPSTLDGELGFQPFVALRDVFMVEVIITLVIAVVFVVDSIGGTANAD